MFEYKDDIKTFEDPDIISIDSIRSAPYKTVTEEIEMGRRLKEERQYWKKEKRSEVKPLFETNLKQLNDERPIMYRCIVETFKPVLPEYVCRHFGNFILDRSIITRNEHINFLSQPKYVRYSEGFSNHTDGREKFRVYYKKILLPNLTSRVDELATPSLRRMKNTIKNYSRFLKMRQLENLTFFLTGRNLENIMSIDKAIMLIQEEKYQKTIMRKRIKRQQKNILEKIQHKRFNQILQITWSLFEIMKDYLMTEHPIELRSEMRLLSNLIIYKIAEISDCDIPSHNSQEFIDKFIINLSDNLSMWLDTFITNSGYPSLQREKILSSEKLKKQHPGDNYDENIFDKNNSKTIEDYKDKKESFYLLIDDYIPLSGSLNSDIEGSLYHSDFEEIIKKPNIEDYLYGKDNEEDSKTFN